MDFVYIWDINSKFRLFVWIMALHLAILFFLPRINIVLKVITYFTILFFIFLQMWICNF